METVRDTMEDLELEFEVLNQLIERLESNKNSIPAMSKSGDEHDDIDIENNSTTTTVSPKAPKKF